jgi:chorismate mutase-like protein
MVGRALLLVALLVACKAPAPLRVGTSGDYAPFSKDGQGFDLDVARQFADALGRPLELVTFRWPELAERIARGDFDVAMSGITWRADRDVRGWLSLAIGQGGPCWIGAAEPASVGVNKGGALEGFAHLRFPEARIVAVEENASLPDLLAAHAIDAIVTDSFEIAHFRRPGDTSLCVAQSYRKVYWVAPARAAELGPALDRFLRAHEPELAKLRARWFGADQPRDAAVHLVDLVARRLELMDAVGAWKRAHGRAIEDPEQEARVLERVAARAGELGLDAASVRALFELEIRLAKRIESETHAGTPNLDLDGELRPAIARLSDRQLELLAAAAPVTAATLGPTALAPLQPLLRPQETAELGAALAAVSRAK